MRKSVFFIIFLVWQVLVCEILKPEVSKENVYIGEEFTVKADIEARDNIQAVFSNETKDVAIIGVEKGIDGKVIIRMVTLVSGEVITPQINLTVNGDVVSIGEFNVKSMNRTQEGDTNLRDLKETVKIMENDLSLLYFLIFAIAAAILVFLVIKLRNKFKKDTAIIEKNIEPYEIALEFINKAKIKRAEGDYESFVDFVTFGLKTYMSAKQMINYKEMTTLEVKRKIKKDSIFSLFDQKIIDTLRLGDKYKFADVSLLENDFDKLIGDFEKIVNDVESLKVKENDAA